MERSNEIEYAGSRQDECVIMDGNMNETYIDIMMQSLKKKLDVLNRIMEVDERQKEILSRNDSDVDDFDKTVDEKELLIDQLDKLDSGFDKLYDQVRQQLQGDRYSYTEQIRLMQEYIRHITDRSMQIQAQEARNKDLLTRKFTQVRKQSKAIRVNSKTTSQYYKNMTKLNVIDPQFMDDKK